MGGEGLPGDGHNLGLFQHPGRRDPGTAVKEGGFAKNAPRFLNAQGLFRAVFRGHVDFDPALLQIIQSVGRVPLPIDSGPPLIHQGRGQAGQGFPVVCHGARSFCCRTSGGIFPYCSISHSAKQARCRRRFRKRNREKPCKIIVIIHKKEVGEKCYSGLLSINVLCWLIVHKFTKNTWDFLETCAIIKKYTGKQKKTNGCGCLGRRRRSTKLHEKGLRQSDGK